MHAAHTGNGWKLLVIMLIGLTGLFIVLVTLASSQVRGGEGDSYVRTVPAQSEKPGPSEDGGSPNFLNDFEIVPGTAILIDNRHVLALYKKADKDIYAVLLFGVDCDRTGCTPNELLAFSIVDGQGQDVQLASLFGATNPKNTRTHA